MADWRLDQRTEETPVESDITILSRGTSTFKTTFKKIKDFIIGTTTLTTTDTTVTGAIEEVKGIADNNTTQLNDLANDKAGVVKGIWTPLLSGSIGECTYEKQEGHYIKIDDLVICTFNLKIATVNTLAGYLAIKGFPFTPVKNAPLLTGAINNIKTTAQLPIGGTLEIDGSCYLKHNALNTFSSALSGTDISDGFDMVCCQVIYRM